jgi:hypothetical protein
VACRPAFDLVAEQCRTTPPAVAEGITGVPALEIQRTAQVRVRQRVDLKHDQASTPVGWAPLAAEHPILQAVPPLQRPRATRGGA